MPFYSDAYHRDQTDHFKRVMLTGLIGVTKPSDILFIKLSVLEDNASDRHTKYYKSFDSFFNDISSVKVLISKANKQTICHFKDKSNAQIVFSDFKLMKDDKIVIEDHSFIFLNPPVGLCGLGHNKPKWGLANNSNTGEHISKKTVSLFIDEISNDQTIILYQYIRAMKFDDIKRSLDKVRPIFSEKREINVYGIMFNNCVFIFLTFKKANKIFKQDFIDLVGKRFYGAEYGI